MTDPTAADPTPTEPTKVTRARARTSDVPKQPPRPKAARKVAPALVDAGETPLPAAPTGDSIPIHHESVRAGYVEIQQGGVDHVEADRVSVSQGGITSVDAQQVDVQMGGIVHVHADEATVRLGGVVLARADHLTVERGGIGAALAREVNIRQAWARSIIAQDARIDQGMVGTMLTGRATFERPSAVLMLIAGRVDGPVRAILDWRGALAFGAAFGLVSAVVRGLVRRR
jgi:hypothetical protein